MRSTKLGLAVAIVTLVTGLITAEVTHWFRKSPQPSPQQQASTALPQEDLDEFPADFVFTPLEIEQFINAHPQARLRRLWERLGIPADPAATNCNDCVAKSVSFNLDEFPDEETILRVGDNIGQHNWRFLIFKKVSAEHEWAMLGYIDIFDRYGPARYSFAMSEGKTFLVLTELSAYGSGLGLYQNRVYRVSHDGITLIISYPGRGLLSGVLTRFPNLEFNARILSCDVDKTQATATLEYVFDYSHPNVNSSLQLLFSKRTRVVVTNRSSWGIPSRPLKSRDDMDYESAVLTFIESMTGTDFLKYNHSELLHFANYGDVAQKRWLKDYLETCDNSSEKQSLLKALGR